MNTYLEAIEKLIDIGRAIDEGDASPDISLMRGWGKLNVRGNKVISYMQSFSDVKLILLIKGITYVGRELRWGGGSVTVCPALFSILVSRGVEIEKLDELSAWVINNTRDSYSPFGGQNRLGARNYSEYINLLNIRSEDQKNEQEKSLLRQQEEKQQRSFCARFRDGPVRENLIEKLNGMTVRDQLILITYDKLWLPNFYPTRCANLATTEVIQSLPKETISSLVIRMKGKYRGRWGAFKKRLLEVYDPVLYESSKSWVERLNRELG